MSYPANPSMNGPARAAAGHYAQASDGSEPVNAGHQYSQRAVAQNGMTQVGDPINGLVGGFATMSLPAGPLGQAGPVVPQLGPNPAYIVPSDGQFYVANYAPAAHAIGAAGMADNAYGPIPVQYVAQGSYAPAYAPYPVVPYTPGRNGIASDRSDRRDVPFPGLENRRGSYSTNESAPATPFYGGMNQRDSSGHVAVVDRSAYNTPSPQQFSAPKMIPDRALELRLDTLLEQHPKIPKAIPAVFTQPHQMKTLEQCLESRIEGNRNVYIRGLHPTTDDETLYLYASRFGKVETSKAIIDTATGACKGFGFAKFYDIADSEMCIRGFHRLGYEVGFAQESFNSRLKAEGDETSTNLYISNLPKNITETELAAIFMDYTILSSKILRDSMGNSRGVGFARFETREICDEIIGKFNGMAVGNEGHVMQVRYADTPAQKELKRVTAERRQFRTNEYNIGAYGTPLVGIHPNIYNHRNWNRNSGPVAGATHARNSGPGTSQNGSQKENKSPESRVKIEGTTQTAVAWTGNTAASDDDGSTDEGVTVHVNAPAVAGPSNAGPANDEQDAE